MAPTVSLVEKPSPEKNPKPSHSDPQPRRERSFDPRAGSAREYCGIPIPDYVKVTIEDLRQCEHLLQTAPNRISVFGSSWARQDSADPRHRDIWNKAFEFGRLAGENGFSVVTGGFSEGVMEAANRGAMAAGAPSIAIPLEAFSSLSDRPYDGLHTATYNFKTIGGRMIALQLSEYYVAFEGGSGTHSELLWTFESVKNGHTDTPIVCVGADFWNRYIEGIMKSSVDYGYLQERDLRHLLVVDSARQALDILVANRMVRTCTDPRQYDLEKMSWSEEINHIKFGPAVSAMISRAFGNLPLLKALDVGTGRGWMLEQLHNIGISSVDGLEPSRRNFDECRVLHPNFCVHYSTLQEFNPDERYDLISLVMVLSHFDDLRETFAKLRSMLAIGGQIVAVVPDYEYSLLPREGCTWRKTDLPGCAYALEVTRETGTLVDIIYPEETYRAQARDAGLKMVESAPIIPTPELLERMPRYRPFEGSPIARIMRFENAD